MNPPFHEGHAAEPALGQAMIKTGFLIAARRRTPAAGRQSRPALRAGDGRDFKEWGERRNLPQLIY
jgi:hypothetical protein